MRGWRAFWLACSSLSLVCHHTKCPWWLFTRNSSSFIFTCSLSSFLFVCRRPHFLIMGLFSVTWSWFSWSRWPERGSRQKSAVPFVSKSLQLLLTDAFVFLLFTRRRPLNPACIQGLTVWRTVKEFKYYFKPYWRSEKIEEIIHFLSQSQLYYHTIKNTLISIFCYNLKYTERLKEFYTKYLPSLILLFACFISHQSCTHQAIF